MNTLHDAPLFLIFHSTYNDIIVGLYRGSTCLGVLQEFKKDSSKKLLPAVHTLLNAHHSQLSDCSFIGAHAGPGPFTTVRVIIASVNGLAFATQLPLIGVNGLTALLDEYKNKSACTIALLDAYCGDLYYAIQSGATLETGCDTFENILLNPLITESSQTLWIGNGVNLNKEKILALPHAFMPDPVPEICTIESISNHALRAWNAQQDLTNQLIPLYMKSGSAIMGKTIAQH